MRRWLRYSLSVLGLLAVLQIAAIALVMAFATPETVDTNWSRQTIFQTDSKMAVYGSPLVAKGSDQPQVIILGSSNTTMGIRPDRLAPYLGEVRVHNLSVGSEKFRAYPQLVDLLFRQTPTQNLHNYVFVFGISYPLTLDEPIERQRMRTSIDDELQRFWLFSNRNPGSAPRIADRYLSRALRWCWPFLVPKTVYNRIVRTLPEVYWFGLAEPVPFSAELSNTIQYSRQQNQDRIDFYNNQQMDMSGEYNFDYLMRAVQRITDAGAQVVIVDLPAAQWLKQATHHYKDYTKLRKPYIGRLEKMRNVRYVNIEHGFKDADFYDGIHPRNRITPDIAKPIAPAIQAALKEIK